MAEGFARSMHSTWLDAASAGTRPKGIDPLAVAAMREAGIDISTQQSKSIDDVRPESVDVVVTVCADAHENCPVWPGAAAMMHRGFDDPPRLAAASGGGDVDEQHAMTHYRRIRDEIRTFVEGLPTALAVLTRQRDMT